VADKFYFEPYKIEQLQASYDVAIIGAGGAGLTAALQAVELGLKPVVFEKMERLGGNTNRASSGMNASETSVQLKHGVIDDFKDFYQETYVGGGKLNDPKLLEYFASHTSQAIAWLQEQGIRLDDLTITGAMSKPRTHRPASTAPIGAFMITNLLKQLQQKQVAIFNQTKVIELMMDDAKQKICGIKLEDADQKIHQVEVKAVILASGGFGASQELMNKYRPDLAHYKTTNHEGATGDGLALATALGAQLRDMDLIQIHPTVQQDNPHVYLIGEAVRGEGAILINQDAKRFVNELATRKIVSNAISALEQKSAYLIFGEEVFKRVQALAFYAHIGLVIQAQSISQLAKQINVDATKLENTLTTWNQAVDSNNDSQFGRTTGLRVIKQAPYYAIHIAPAIHYTMGGIHADQYTRVLDENGTPIAGLYAAGEVVGGLHGNNRIGGNSIAETVVFGRQAAIQVARYLQN
jgi:fumarate reductase flavoprotein subunit